MVAKSETGISTAIVKWIIWRGVVLNSSGLYRKAYYGLTYLGGIIWLVKRLMSWYLLKNHAVMISTRCLAFLDGAKSSITAAEISTLPLLLIVTLGNLRSLLRD